MPTREEMIREMKRRDMIDHLKAQDAGPAEKSIGDKALAFGKSFAQGSSIGEHLPLVGGAIADTGTKIGSGLEALIEAPFVDETVGQLYDRNMAANDKAKAQRAEIDAQSPMAQGIKEIMGELPLLAQKRDPYVAPVKPGPAPADPFTKPGGFAARQMEAEREAAQVGKFNYPKDTPQELAQWADEAAAAAPKVPGMLQKTGQFLKEEIPEMLPYKVRLMMRLAEKYGKGGK